MNALVSISYCADHYKGADPERAMRLRGQTHAEWLEDACRIYYERGLPVIVCCTGFRGMLNVEVSPQNLERDVMWRIFRKARAIVGVPENPGHQVGAALCIRQGLECASKLGYDLLIHTAEDVLPLPGVLREMQSTISGGSIDYVGSFWGPQRDELNSQFFACRVQSLVGKWDSAAVTGHGCIEKYLASLVRFSRVHHLENYYRSTHDYDEWQRWRKEIESR